VLFIHLLGFSVQAFQVKDATVIVKDMLCFVSFTVVDFLPSLNCN